MEEPAFLRRLRQGQSGMEQQQRYIAPRNKKSSTGDDEDAPTYVLEGGNETISVEEFKAMNSGDLDNDKEDEEKPDPPTTETGILPNEDTVSRTAQSGDTKEQLLEVGSKTNKRKAVKIVGAGGDDDKRSQEDDKIESKKRTGRKPKGKQKVKLSFGEDESG